MGSLQPTRFHLLDGMGLYTWCTLGWLWSSTLTEPLSLCKCSAWAVLLYRGRAMSWMGKEQILAELTALPECCDFRLCPSYFGELFVLQLVCCCRLKLDSLYGIQAILVRQKTLFLLMATASKAEIPFLKQGCWSYDNAVCMFENN